MKVEFQPAVLKQLQQLPRPVFRAVLQTIVELVNDPRPVGVRKLAGPQQDWRIRVGEYRVIYSVDDGASSVRILRAAHRRESYR